MKQYRGLLGPVAVVVLAVTAMLWSPFEPHQPPVGASGPFDVRPTWLDEDWEVFTTKVEWAGEHRLDTLPIGEAMAELGRSFVGTAYVPRTLEVEGPERLVINFRGLDCVTFVENVFAITRFVRGGGVGRLGDRGRAEAAYETLLREVRYRDARIAGYPSRLHYFSDWIRDNDRRGLVRDISEPIGGVRDLEPIDFMTEHFEAYAQLSDPDNVAGVRRTEELLSAAERHFVPAERIDDVAAEIHDGDIIAATSTVAGLDVAHTGLALWIDGSLHLLHAPLVGEAVQISEVSLAERVARIDGQDGIMVARPLGS